MLSFLYLIVTSLSVPSEISFQCDKPDWLRSYCINTAEVTTAAECPSAFGSCESRSSNLMKNWRSSEVTQTFASGEALEASCANDHVLTGFCYGTECGSASSEEKLVATCSKVSWKVDIDYDRCTFRTGNSTCEGEYAPTGLCLRNCVTGSDSTYLRCCEFSYSDSLMIQITYICFPIFLLVTVAFCYINHKFEVSANESKKQLLKEARMTAQKRKIPTVSKQEADYENAIFEMFTKRRSNMKEVEMSDQQEPEENQESCI